MGYFFAILITAFYLLIAKVYRIYFCTHYLYIIPFSGGNYFKFGITNNLKRRLGEHERAGYKFNRKKVWYIKQERKEVQRLETLIKAQINCTAIHPYSSFKGGTEVRSVRDMYIVKEILKGYLFI